jgi:hypothetical protein
MYTGDVCIKHCHFKHANICHDFTSVTIVVMCIQFEATKTAEENSRHVTPLCGQPAD